jgi:hypothetical protein
MSNELIVANGLVPTGAVTPYGQPIIEQNIPMLIDLRNREKRPIAPFLNGVIPRSRNLATAIQQGPFARVINTEGTCLNIRAEPGSGAALDCAAEGVLLRDLREFADVAGVTWLRVATPAGLEGWASTQYLER